MKKYVVMIDGSVDSTYDDEEKAKARVASLCNAERSYTYTHYEAIYIEEHEILSFDEWAESKLEYIDEMKKQAYTDGNYYKYNYCSGESTILRILADDIRRGLVVLKKEEPENESD